MSAQATALASENPLLDFSRDSVDVLRALLGTMTFDTWQDAEPFGAFYGETIVRAATDAFWIAPVVPASGSGGPLIRIGTFFADPIEQVMRYAADQVSRGSLQETFDILVAFSRSPSHRTARKLGLKNRNLSPRQPWFQFGWPIDALVRQWKSRHDDHPPGAGL